MQSNKSKVGIIVAVALIVMGSVAVVYALTNTPDNEQTSEQTSAQTETAQQPVVEQNNDEAASDLPTIVFTDEGFSQSEYRFAAGTDIRVENQSSMDMQFSSDDHPTHRDDPELNLPVLGAGESGTFTPPGKGTFGFHDHINDQYEGILIIE